MKSFVRRYDLPQRLMPVTIFTRPFWRFDMSLSTYESRSITSIELPSNRLHLLLDKDYYRNVNLIIDFI